MLGEGNRIAVIGLIFAFFIGTAVGINDIFRQGSTYMLESPSSDDTNERASPSDWIEEENIHVYEDRVVIDLEGAEWAKFTDSNSMDPVLDKGSNAIQIIPDDPAQINEGDIISYRSDSGSVIIHRVQETGEDEEGWYAIAKGDNNDKPDPQLVRFDDIGRVTVAVIY